MHVNVRIAPVFPLSRGQKCFIGRNSGSHRPGFFDVSIDVVLKTVLASIATLTRVPWFASRSDRSCFGFANVGGRSSGLLDEFAGFQQQAGGSIKGGCPTMAARKKATRKKATRKKAGKKKAAKKKAKKKARKKRK